MKRLDPNSPAARHLAQGRYVIRQADAAVLARVHIPWMRQAGWNPGLHDAETFICADPQGFLVGELDGQPIACVSGVRYDSSFGFMGCYLVQEAFRGQGYGLAIHEAARAHLEGCTQGGDGVLANVDVYQQIGRVYAYRNARYEGRKQTVESRRGAALIDVRTFPLALIEELDRACFPAPRRSFLEAWINQPDAHGVAIVEPGGRSKLRGYGVIRQCFTGWKIGPLFARDPETAEAIFCGLIERIPATDSFVLDVAEPNSRALDLVKRYGMSDVFATARMFTGPFPQVNLDWVYGVTTFELG
ncbi:MAG: GNAT family N-acetyltransferase [Verrucomicrobia bacterium]|nr:GNAT family N-acetyltransferase [Verrucomicrobiota bacterium]